MQYEAASHRLYRVGVTFDVRTLLMELRKTAKKLCWIFDRFNGENRKKIVSCGQLGVYVKVSYCFQDIFGKYSEPKNTPKCFCHIFYKTQSILIKFGTHYPE